MSAKAARRGDAVALRAYAGAGRRKSSSRPGDRP
jgi:hypothetical protein